MKTAAIICRVLSLVIMLLVLIIYLPLAVPGFFGIDSYAVISGSMEPTIKVGSVVYSRQVNPSELQEGEIIVFLQPGASATVTHRVVKNNTAENLLTTKGDANQDDDFLPVAYSSVLGRIVFTVPFLGMFADYASSLTGKAAAVVFLIVSVLLGILAGLCDSTAKKSTKESSSGGVRAVAWVFLAIFIGVGTYGGLKFYRSFSQRKTATDEYEAMTQYLAMPSEQPQQESVEVSLFETEEAPVEEERPRTPTPSVDFAIPEVDFEALYADGYENCNAWIYIPDTPINYAVFYDGENDFYLHHNGRGASSASGAIFLDGRNSGRYDETHSILYGHHMADGSMFAGLKRYKEETYAREHRFGVLITERETRLIEFFAGNVADVSSDSWQIEYDGEEGYVAWISAQLAKSAFTTGTTPLSGDSVITLSTCSYEFNNARFVLHGILYPADSSAPADEEIPEAVAPVFDSPAPQETNGPAFSD